jgi:hypothetical protein
MAYEAVEERRDPENILDRLFALLFFPEKKKL